MYGLIFLAAPFAIATLLTAILGGTWRRCTLILGLGLVLALGFVLYAYLSSPPDPEHDTNGCSDCEEFLGRWWEPVFVAWLTLVACFAWVVGVAAGALLRGVVSVVRKRPASP